MDVHYCVMRKKHRGQTMTNQTKSIKEWWERVFGGGNGGIGGHG